MKKLTTAIASSAVLLLASAPAFANGPKVTGGADQILAGNIYFSMAANAVLTGKGEVKGSIQYSREDQPGVTTELFVHADVACFGISTDGAKAVVAGPAKVQSNPAGLKTGDWLIIAIKEGGTGYGDSVRVSFGDSTEGFNRCEAPQNEGTFPGLVYEGEFKLRP